MSAPSAWGRRATRGGRWRGAFVWAIMAAMCLACFERTASAAPTERAGDAKRLNGTATGAGQAKDEANAGEANSATSTEDAKGGFSEQAVDAEAIAAAVQKLSMAQRVAQLMLVTLEGVRKPDALDSMFMKNYPPGGIMMPPVMKPGTAAEYTGRLRALPMESTGGVPALIGTNLYDLPRLMKQGKGGFAPLPSLLSVAAAHDPEVTRSVGSFIADHLTWMGFNLHVGPPLELAPTLPDAQGTTYCLGADPASVASDGATLIGAIAARGIIAMPTGFPGGGNERLGHEPAVLLTPRAALAQRDLAPFKAAVEAGAPIVLVGNTLAPTLDPTARPASLSRVVMKDLLRDQLGFAGVVVAGPMDSGDVARVADPSDAAIQSLEAGADMLYWQQAGQRVMKTVDEIVAAIDDGTLSEEVVNAAVVRVLTLKQRFGLAKRPAAQPKKADAALTKRTYPKMAYAVERRAITLVQNRDNVLPLTKARSMPVGLTGTVGVQALRAALEKHLKAIPTQEIATAKYGGELYDFEIRRVTARAEIFRTVIVTLTPDLRNGGELQLIDELKTSGRQVVVVLVGCPRDLSLYSQADAILVTYAEPDACGQAMVAMAEALVGKGAVEIRPPEKDVRVPVAEEETFSVFDVVRAPSGRLPIAAGEEFPAGFAVGYDPALAIKKAEWDFGDGSRAKGLSVTKAFETSGRYPLTLTLTDIQGEVRSRTFFTVAE